MTVLEDLVKLLALERIEENLFRGQSQDLGWGTVFGGQVVGQALSAAAQTVPKERHVHSLHAYFLRPGDVSRPIVYDVDRIRDGSSFTTRRVVAIQNGKPIFNLSCSFQKDEPGFEHQEPMPEAPPPETVKRDQDRFAAFADRLPAFVRERAVAERPIDLRIVGEEDDPFLPNPKSARRMVWLKAAHALPDDPALHAYLLAYASDFAFVTTAMLPHGKTWLTPGMQVASIDHVMWFHRRLRIDEWLLYVMDSPAAQGARGLARGLVFTRDGALVASSAQEGLMRQR
ncbi:MAG: acyl-CoA thioesterase II [Labilithrix sp.]|nr:acyl-CoA thioesterase II [Labilithrix sp.]MCW5817076.1 acyl-CoA thioesterase II [Labilithrix sp.]